MSPLSHQQDPVPPDCSETITALLRQNTPVTFQAGGSSMTPVIPEGERVRVRPVQPRDLRRGTIFLYQTHGRLVLHRMVRCSRKTGTVWMTGDAALSGTEKVPLTALAGTAQWVLKNGKRQRLDSGTARRSGMVRFALRPLRRLLQMLCLHMCIRPEKSPAGQ